MRCVMNREEHLDFNNAISKKPSTKQTARDHHGKILRLTILLRFISTSIFMYWFSIKRFFAMVFHFQCSWLALLMTIKRYKVTECIQSLSDLIIESNACIFSSLWFAFVSSLSRKIIRSLVRRRLKKVQRTKFGFCNFFGKFNYQTSVDSEL